ncbi:MAG TPA: carbon storage regulator [Pirellulaceae bacterium]|nr:carbon storage regulator [Pirellulaceae bacterium]HMO94072.1 carbon storage regulator [Pirellulaceae bacterium]HMP70920.1 carbon storage regulator [Pirellulaceae bacterium]
MLVLSRKLGEMVHVDNVEIIILKIKGSQVRLGFVAPEEKRIRRSEILESKVSDKLGPHRKHSK